MTLRECLLCQSIYACKLQQDIVKLIEYQPNPQVFFKTFFELEKTNLVTILSFDSRCIKALFNEKYKDTYDRTYPLFYKIKYNLNKQEVIISAIDISLKNNQIRAT